MPTSAPTLVWFRQDLRLDDHLALTAACAQATSLLPVYCVDPRAFAPTRWGFPRTQGPRIRFWEESLTALRTELQAQGSDLLVVWGHPEEELPRLVRELGASAVHAHAEIAPEEAAVEARLREQLPPGTLHLHEGNQLFEAEDLPFTLETLPDIFSQFRKQVERAGRIRKPLPVPAHLPPLPDALPLPASGSFPDAEREPDARAVLAFSGGAPAGRQRVQAYFWETHALQQYKVTRNGLLGANYSSKLSPWLAFGCLSPRWVFAEVERYEAEVLANDSTYWLKFELLWREFFRWIGRRYGVRLFRRAGLRDLPAPDTVDGRFAAWAAGQTGVPFVDANLRELQQTGFMSNRGRQNVASFLVKDLQQDWRAGAAWFESWLLDYDVCSNWGNWAYVAGVGNDPRDNRTFNVVLQAQRYDPQGAYVQHWLPELAGLEGPECHTCLGWTSAQRHARGLNYPLPLVIPPPWRKYLGPGQRSD